MRTIRLPEATWRAQAAAHAERVDGWVAPHLQRRRTGTKHPVEDFLFTYYSYRPAQLRRWHPGAGVVLEGGSAAELGAGYIDTPSGATLDTASVLRRRGDFVTWVWRLLTRTAARQPHLGCFGMHEWAMVYLQSPDELRHRGWRLRLSPEHTAEVVRQNRIRCSHFDAYRFFTPAARPLNAFSPTRESQPDLEQPGCLHANMDLYKWAYKLSPLVPSDLVADCFELARRIRALDMQASPYDLTDLGYQPVPVETAEGRGEYARRQREFAEEAALLRARLIDALRAVASGLHEGEDDHRGSAERPGDEQATGEVAAPASGQHQAGDDAPEREKRLRAEERHRDGGDVLEAAAR